jgi:octaprenyl-diphosphate synthase
MCSPAVRDLRPSPLADALSVVAEEMAQAEELLLEGVSGPVPLMPRVARHLVGAGGKRLRPLLCLLAARLAEVPRELAVRAAVAGELIHTASLLHDDVVDEAPLRRGRPSAPRVFGNSACVLMGDALLARSIALLADLEVHAPVAGLARCVRRMATGELLQLTMAGRPGSTLISYLRIVEGKTSGLFAWCCTAGDLCPPSLRSPLRRFGRRMGMAFQIADDILDYAGDPAITGKVVGSDLRERKVTLPLHFACQRQPELGARVQALVAAGLDAPPPDPDEVASLVRAVHTSGGLEMARAAATTLLARAHGALDEVPSSPWRSHLHALADFVVARAS